MCKQRVGLNLVALRREDSVSELNNAPLWKILFLAGLGANG